MTAMKKKPTSRRNGALWTRNGLMIHIEPTTHDTMNDAAPSNSPMAKLPISARIADSVEKRSGEPLPKARKVTPAKFSSRPRSWAMEARLGVKKSEALIPRVENRKKSHETRVANRNGRSTWSAQK